MAEQRNQKKANFGVVRGGRYAERPMRTFTTSEFRLDREMQAAQASDELLVERARALLYDMPVGSGYPEIDDWAAGTWQRSETYFNLALIPKEMKLGSLDLRDELKFVQLIRQYFIRVRSTTGAARPVAGDAPNRSGDFYEYRWYHWNGNYEARWRVTNRCEIAQATQVKL